MDLDLQRRIQPSHRRCIAQRADKQWSAAKTDNAKDEKQDRRCRAALGGRYRVLHHRKRRGQIGTVKANGTDMKTKANCHVAT